MGDLFLRRKWERAFNTFFDINRNRSIDWNDFELLFEKIKECRGEESTEYKIASDSMGAVWRGILKETKNIDMAAEVPPDTVVSIEEWDKMWKKFDPKKMSIWQKEYVKYMFFLLDSSGDKVIDKSEYTEVMKLYEMSKFDAERSFDKFAVENGKKINAVDYGQWTKLFCDYFHSPDRNAPGNFIFGTW